MKTLMLGNEAAARGLYEAGCGFVSSYPGTPSTEVSRAVDSVPRAIGVLLWQGGNIDVV